MGAIRSVASFDPLTLGRGQFGATLVTKVLRRVAGEGEGYRGGSMTSVLLLPGFEE